MRRARHIAISFEFAQLAGQYAIRDIPDQALDLIEALRPVFQHREDQEAPFVPDLVENIAKRTVFRLFEVLDSYLEHATTLLCFAKGGSLVDIGQARHTA